MTRGHLLPIGPRHDRQLPQPIRNPASPGRRDGCSAPAERVPDWEESGRGGRSAAVAPGGSCPSPARVAGRTAWWSMTPADGVDGNLLPQSPVEERRSPPAMHDSDALHCGAVTGKEGGACGTRRRMRGRDAASLSPLFSRGRGAARCVRGAQQGPQRSGHPVWKALV